MPEISPEVKPISNEDWIAFLFDDLPENALPMGCSFAFDPKDVSTEESRKKWGCSPLPVGMKLFKKGFSSRYSPDYNNYVGISSFYPDAEGMYLKRDTHFAALHAIMIDDIGPKVSIDKIVVMPSLLVETSKGNFQAWYKLDPVVRSLESANMLVSAFVNALNHDGSSVTRLGRLPVGSNTKGGGVVPQVVRAAPLTRHNPMDLVKAFSLTLKKPEARNVIPHPMADLTARWLHENGYVIRAKENGWLSLHCPLGTHDDDGATGYLPPTPSKPNGHFHCPHAKCANKGTSDLLAFIEAIVAAKVARFRSAK